MDNQECLSVTTHLRNHRQNQSLWSQIFHQIWCSMGIQQHMHQSKMVINGKQHSRPTSDYMNQQLCSLDYATPLWHSKQWWMTPSKKSKRDFALYTWKTFSFSPRTKKISNDSPNTFLKASRKPTFISNHWNVNFAKWRLNILALLSKKARWWWTPPNSMESVIGQSPRALNKYAPSLDLETFLNASLRDSPNLPNPWTNSYRKTNYLFGTSLLSKLSTKWRNTSLKNQSLWCWIKHDLFKLNVMHQNMHLVESSCNLMSMVIDTYVPLYHEPSLWWNGITKSMTTNFYQWSGPSMNGDTISKDLHIKWQFIQIIRTSHISRVPRNLIDNKPDDPFFYISEYDIKLVHLPGSRMILSDTLSWWPDFVPEKDTNNKNIVLLPDQLFINLIDIELQ